MQCVKVGKIYGTCALCSRYLRGTVRYVRRRHHHDLPQPMSQFVSLPILFTVPAHSSPQGTEVRTQGHYRCSRYAAYGAFMIPKPCCYPTSGERFIICTPSLLCCSSLNLPSCGI